MFLTYFCLWFPWLLCYKHQALQLGQDANSPYGFFNGQRCQMCLRSDPLHKVMERLANPGTSFFYQILLWLVQKLLIVSYWLTLEKTEKSVKCIMLELTKTNLWSNFIAYSFGKILVFSFVKTYNFLAKGDFNLEVFGWVNQIGLSS